MKKLKYLLRVARKEFWYWQIRMAWRYTRPLGRGKRSYPSRLRYIYTLPKEIPVPYMKYAPDTIVSMETGEVIDQLMKELCQTQS